MPHSGPTLPNLGIFYGATQIFSCACSIWIQYWATTSRRKAIWLRNGTFRKNVDIKYSGKWRQIFRYNKAYTAKFLFLRGDVTSKMYSSLQDITDVSVVLTQKTNSKMQRVWFPAKKYCQCFVNGDKRQFVTFESSVCECLRIEKSKLTNTSVETGDIELHETILPVQMLDKYFCGIRNMTRLNASPPLYLTAKIIISIESTVRSSFLCPRRNRIIYTFVDFLYEISVLQILRCT